ncbi:hypothetical protein F6Y05_01560 (plasmid) [Bacillus megaterium]|nr:hypothetical protein [Priestia megaterium]NGY85175.1 hypothetical protein [Priestia megaterium]
MNRCNEIEGGNKYVFSKDVVLVSIKAIGEKSAIVQYRDQEEEVFLHQKKRRSFINISVI